MLSNQKWENQFSISVQGVSGQEAGHCIMYDTCGWDADYGPDGGNQVHFLNCHYTGPAKPATDEMLEILQEVCPHLYANGEVPKIRNFIYIL